MGEGLPAVDASCYVLLFLKCSYAGRGHWLYFELMADMKKHQPLQDSYKHDQT